MQHQQDAAPQPTASSARSDDARRQAELIQDMLTSAARQAREDGRMVQDKEARALFETTAEVLNGLTKAYEDYARRSEAAWQ